MMYGFLKLRSGAPMCAPFSFPLDIIPTERSERRNPPNRKTQVVALGDPSTNLLRNFVFGTAQYDIL